MRPVSAAFLEAIRGSHAMRSRVRVVPPGLTGTNPNLDMNGNVQHEIAVSGGDVKLDATADIRGSLDMETTASWPAGASDLLTPYGNELFVERGIVFGSGAVEWVSLGYFRISDIEQDDAPDGPLHIVAHDRMAGIVDSKLEAPRQYTTGTSVQTVFDDLVGEIYPAAVIVYDFDAANTLFSASHVAEEDRYAFLKAIVDSLGKVMFWDYQGRLQVVTAPDPTVPVLDINHGRGGILVKLSRSLSRQGAFNAVIATGEAAGEKPPVRGVAYDTNPNSPTYWFGPFGKVPYKMSSSFITTPDQARTAAEQKLARSIGVPYSADFESVVCAALEPLDPIRVTHSDREAGDYHVVEMITLPLDAETAMSGTTRQQIWGGANA
ncbi:MAG TPA: DUF5047 domain-containing protein [Kribbella sp.]|nr:DUF5047 domain-containing protein [Kribbella sp.]